MLRRELYPPVRLVLFAFVIAAMMAAIVWSASAATVQAQDNSPTATVLVAKLNVRSGPGTTYARVGAVNAKDVLTVLGQAQNCAWLKVQSKQVSGWVSGQPAYVKLSVPCSKIPAAAVDATVAATGATTTTTAPAHQSTPAAKATAAPTAAPTAGATATATPVPTAVPASEAQDEDPLPKDMACFLMRNEVGPELNVTLTNKDSGKADNFRVPPSGEKVWCLYPGRYAATIDAPPPWNSINDDFSVQAGERFVWPIKGEQ
jgi:hypothetical protein